MPDIVEQPCDCPNCTGDTADPERMLTEIVDNAVSLAEVDDPLDAELAGALFVAMAQTGGDDAADAFAGAFVPALEARSSRAALTLLTAINSMAADEPSPVTVAAGEAAGRLAEAGVAAPVWAAELTQPLTAGPLTKLYDAEGSMSVLIGVFERAGRGHSIVLVVDHENCGAADQIYLVGEEELPILVAGVYDNARAQGVSVKTKKLSAPEFRWYAEQALEIRADHDAEDERDAEVLLDEDGPGYAPLTVLTRSRLATLPPARRPRGAPASPHVAGSN